MAVIICKEVSVPDLTPPPGTTWLFEESGSFNVPATGQYNVELHGGGGGLATAYSQFGTRVATGGGSGQSQQVQLTKGETIQITIGAAGSSGNAGGASSFGSLVSVNGGGGGTASSLTATGGAASGNIASAGTIGFDSQTSVSGGVGNTDNPTQRYGNGAYWGGGTVVDAEPGACIVMFVG